MDYLFDLDGTLIDSSERMYTLFKELIPDCKLSKEMYWYYKRNGINHEKMIEQLYPKVSFSDFEKKWISLIESNRFLMMDVNYSDTILTLSKLKGLQNNCYLLTARHSKEHLDEELNRLGLEQFFSEIMITEGLTKQQLLENKIKNNSVPNNTVFISDMGKDIELGNILGYHTIAITHGFMSKEKLVAYKPSRIINELSELLMVNDII